MEPIQTKLTESNGEPSRGPTRTLLDVALSLPMTPWEAATLPYAQSFPDAKLDIVYSKTDPDMPVAVGYITKSMHAYSHWGMNLPYIRPGYEGSAEVRNLVDSLMEYASERVKPFLNANGELVQRYPSDQLAIGLATVHSDVFQNLGFRSVHEHVRSTGETMHFMMKIESPDPITFHKREFNYPKCEPAMHPTVLPLTTEERLEKAKQLIEEVWQAGDEFVRDIHWARTLPGSQAYGVFEDGEIKSVGMICKSLSNESGYERAWIATREKDRGNGYASRLLRGLNHHALTYHLEGIRSKEPFIINGHTEIPGMYERFGNQPVAQRPPDGPDSHRSFTMWAISNGMAHTMLVRPNEVEALQPPKMHDASLS